MSFMDELRQFKFKVKPSRRSTVVAISLTVVVAVSALLVLHSITLDAQARAEQWRAQAQQLEQENQNLEDKIDNLGTLEGIKDIAQDELGMVDPDTVIVTPEN